MKKWNAVIFDGDMNVALDKQDNEMNKNFNTSSDAERWVDNRLVAGGSDWQGVITFLPTKRIVVVERADSIARVYKYKKGPFCRTQGKKSTGSLGFGVKVKDDGYKGYKPS